MASFVREESFGSVRIFWLEQDELIQALRKTAERVGRSNEDVLRIYLFGSIAEKRGVPGSDADVLVILKKSNRPFMERIVEWRQKFQIDFPIEVFPYTEKELGNPIAEEGTKRGVLLYTR